MRTPLAATYDILESADVEFIYEGLTAVVDSNDPWGTGSSTSEALNGNAWWINAIGANSAWDFDNYYNLDYLCLSPWAWWTPDTRRTTPI